MTVRLQRAHAEFLGQGEGLLIVGLGLLNIRGLTPCCDVTEQAQGICLVGAFLVLTGMRQCPLSVGVRLLQTASQHLCLSQREMTERLIAYYVHGHRLFQRLREQRHGVGNAPA